MTGRIVCIWKRNETVFRGDFRRGGARRGIVKPNRSSRSIRRLPRIGRDPAKKKETLEASRGNGVKFTAPASLLAYLLGMEPDAKQGLFNFKFEAVADVGWTGRCVPLANASCIRCDVTLSMLLLKLLRETDQ